jgi:F-type H+-transporting ATPase subunit b
VLVVVSQAGGLAEVRVVLQQEGEGGAEATTEEEPPNPILPVGKEIIWSFATFILLFLIMRFFLYPRLKKGMDARYAHIRGQLEDAESVRASAEAEAVQYQAALAEVRAQASSRIDAARQQLEGERQQRLGEVNAGIGEEKARAAESVDAARQAAMGQVEQAVGAVATTLAEHALGAPVDQAAAREAAAEAVRVGAAR